MGLLDFFQKKTAGAPDNKPVYLDENQLVVIQFFYGIADLNELHEAPKPKPDAQSPVNSMDESSTHSSPNDSPAALHTSPTLATEQHDPE